MRTVRTKRSAIAFAFGDRRRAEATFFDANGTVTDTGYGETEPVAGVRYPLRIYGHDSSVRAELVTSISCF